MLTTKQQNAIESGWHVARAAELLSGYVRRMLSDEHTADLVNNLCRTLEAFDRDYDAVYDEHEAAEDAIASVIDATSKRSAKAAARPPKVAARLAVSK